MSHQLCVSQHVTRLIKKKKDNMSRSNKNKGRASELWEMFVLLFSAVQTTSGACAHFLNNTHGIREPSMWPGWGGLRNPLIGRKVLGGRPIQKICTLGRTASSLRAPDPGLYSKPAPGALPLSRAEERSGHRMRV